MNEKELREVLTMAIINNSNIEANEDDEILFTDVDSVESYKECNILTMDEGVVIRFNNGKAAYITIQVI